MWRFHTGYQLSLLHVANKQLADKDEKTGFDEKNNDNSDTTIINQAVITLV